MTAGVRRGGEDYPVNRSAFPADRNNRRTAALPERIVAPGRERRASRHIPFGRFLVSFDDGKTGTLFPFLAEDILYLLDLVPRKSLFLRAEYDEDFPMYRAEAMGF